MTLCTLNRTFLMQNLIGFKITQIQFLTLILKQKYFLTIVNDFVCTFKEDYEERKNGGVPLNEAKYGVNQISMFHLILVLHLLTRNVSL